jgi:aldehyde dehydrogenase (NAD+)
MPDIKALEKLRSYFNSGITQDYHFRKGMLKKLRSSILDHEQDLYTAYFNDLKKSAEEGWVTETGMVMAELNTAIRNLKSWMIPERVATNLLNMPSRSWIMKEPLGVVLIIGPWNYPFQLLINPLIGAIAAGNCVVVKPSEFAPATAAVMKKMIRSVFPEEYILYADGDGAVIIPEMMNRFSFDHVFYTGSTAVGKLIYKMAAERLVPVTLELGGKSPCVVESDANIKVAARRIAMTKFSNAGQMCVAPDYVLVHESVQNELIEEMKKTIREFYSGKPEEHYNYGKIINERQFNRLLGYLSQGDIVCGGRTDKESLFIEPTLITNIQMDSPAMKEEIFGPVLPVISFTGEDEALSVIRQSPNPLAFYVYTSSKEKEMFWLQSVPAGGACVNNCSWHLTNHHLPFGGRGFSGMGSYHGQYSFDTFSHKKAVMKTPTWFDPSIKYPPLKGKLSLYKKVIR